MDAGPLISGYELADDLDLEALHADFTRAGRILIPNVLTPASLERLTQAIEQERAWVRGVRLKSGTFSVPLDDREPRQEAHRNWLEEARPDPADPGMQYIFDTRRLSTERAMGLARKDALAAFHDFLNGEDFLAFARAVTGDGRPACCEAQAARYRPGDFLTLHSDRDSKQARLYAWVFNLSREWRADWGGLLTFHDEDGRVVETFTPLYGSLSLFRVPMSHAVGQVASFAPRDRLSVSGWLQRETAA